MAAAAQTAAMDARKKSLFLVVARWIRNWILNWMRRWTRTAVAEAVLWPRRIRTRRRLQALSCRDLKDIGLSENERRRECQKPFWLP